jgi:5-methylcytosine-specific restriction enzyme A
MKNDACELCVRSPIKLYRHHLVPQSRKNHSDEYGAIARICRDCHRKIHATWDNKVLAEFYQTVGRIRSAPEIQSYLKWIKKQAPTSYFGSRTKGGGDD